MSSTTLIRDCAVATGVDYLPKADLLIAGGKIRKIAPRLPAGSARVISGAGLLASPGLIDTQLNGGFGHSFSDATPAEVADVGRKLLSFGVTGYLPTLISQPRKTTLRGIEALVAAEGIPGGATILGIHLEGPFLAPKRNGAHQLSNLRLPTLGEFREYHKAAKGLLRMMTLAPERKGALDVIRDGSRRGVIMSAGHSEATAQEIRLAVLKGGLRHVTHVFNAMSPLHHREETILNAALLIDSLSCGFIYDRDHISSGPATLLLKLKPPGQLVLVSDAVAAMGLPDGELKRDGEVYVIKDGVVRVKSNGRLAGSASSILDGVRRLIEDTGIAPHRALALASHAPARLLGLEGRKGILKPGADADVVLLDRSLGVRMTFVGESCSMEIIIERDAAALAERAAQVVFAELAKKPDLVFGLATGKTPVGLYERLRLKPDAFEKVRFFNLDEFFGLPPSDPNSFHSFLHVHLIKHIKHQEKNLHLLRGDVKDLDAQSREVEEKIKAVGGIDLQILGIGGNGHVAFNEPGSSLGSRTRPKTLEASTWADNMKGLDPTKPLPNFAITMGVGTIMDARHLLLLASGEGKAAIIREMVEGPVTSEVPASALQLHPRATVVLDEAAAAKLKRRDYYKWVFENKWRVGQK